MTSERSIQRDIDNHCKNCSRLADQKAKIREDLKIMFFQRKYPSPSNKLVISYTEIEKLIDECLK